jgi:hypothetical protein
MNIEQTCRTKPELSENTNKELPDLIKDSYKTTLPAPCNSAPKTTPHIPNQTTSPAEHSIVPKRYNSITEQSEHSIMPERLNSITKPKYV